MKKKQIKINWLELLEILTVLLTVGNFLILTSKVLSTLTVIVGGMLLLAVIAVLATVTIGIIFLTPFGANLWNTFINFWNFKIGENVLTVLHTVHSFTNWGSLIICAIYLTLSILNKSKKHIIISSIFLALSITLIVLYFLGIGL